MKDDNGNFIDLDGSYVDYTYEEALEVVGEKIYIKNFEGFDNSAACGIITGVIKKEGKIMYEIFGRLFSFNILRSGCATFECDIPFGKAS